MDEGDNLVNVIVFGGGGFLGSSIVDRLLLAGHTVKIFEHPDVLPYREFKKHEKLKWLKGDWLDSECVANALNGEHAVIHLISTTLPRDSNILKDVKDNLLPTICLLEAMASKKINKLIFCSSGGTVYGEPVYTPIDEVHPKNPKVLYGVTKLAIENYICYNSNEYGLDSIILRLSNPYGERQKPGKGQGIIATFLDKALKGEPIDIWGDGSVQRDYLYVEDIAEAFLTALTYSGKTRIFNIGSGEGKTINELLDLIESCFGFHIIRNYHTPRSFDVRINILNNSLAKNELKWTPTTNLIDGLKRTVGNMIDGRRQG